MAAILTNGTRNLVILPDGRKDGLFRAAVKIKAGGTVTITDESHRNITVPAGISVQVVADSLVDTSTDVGATAPVKVAIIGSEAAAPTVLVDGPDLATTQALANDLKAKYNGAVILINEMQAKMDAMNA